VAAVGRITLHTPLTPETRHIVDTAAIEQMKPGVMIVNTGRGALIDTAAVIAGLKNGRIGYAEQRLGVRARPTERQRAGLNRSFEPYVGLEHVIADITVVAQAS